MNSDFLDAHKRHWMDAELLKTESRLANTDHLYGLSAECGLKGLMIQFGMGVNSGTGSPQERMDRVHADKIWERFDSYRSGHPQGTGYPVPSENPFDDWNVSQRYAHRDQFDEVRIDRHRRGAEYVRKLLSKAQKDGLI